MSNDLENYQPAENILLHKDIRFHPELCFGQRLFYAELLSMKNCPYSSAKLANLFGVSHTTIIKWIRNLTSLNMIEVVINFKKKPCEYFITLKSPSG